MFAASLAAVLIPTYRRAARMALLDDAPADDAYIPSYTAPTIAGAGLAAIEWLREAFGRHVEEPRGQGWEQIDDLIRGELGLNWPTADPTWKRAGVAYGPGATKFQWCGATVARAYGHAGLLHAVRYKHMASTGRLYRFARGTDRMVELDALQAGDIILVGARRKNAKGRVLVEGEHVAMVDRVADGYVVTLEGNAKGRGPDGRIFEGIVRRTRPLPKSAGGAGWSWRARCQISGLRQTMEVMHAIRFLAEDFDYEAAS